MKKLLLVLIIFAILPAMSFATDKDLVEGNLSILLMGSVWTGDKFETVEGGIKIGSQYRISEEKGMWFRTIFSQWNIGGAEDESDRQVQAISTSVLMDFFLGKKWKFYVDVGAQNYVSGENTNTDLFGGIGASRRIWTGDRPTANSESVPASFDAFGEISLTDADGNATGSYAQLNFGVKFNQARK